MKITGMGRHRYHHHDMALAKWWSSLVLTVAVAGILGCADTIQLVPSGDKGGVVTYPVKGSSGAITSPYRREALLAIDQYCRGPYDLLREGETRSRTHEAHTGVGAEMTVQRRWGIQFRCQ